MIWKSRFVRSLLFDLMFVAALWYLGVYGHVWLIALSVTWGAVLAAGMLHGIYSATLPNWERKRHWFHEFVGMTILLGVFAVPCLPILIWEGFLPAFAAAWLILLGAVLVFTASYWVFGPAEQWKLQHGQMRGTGSK